MDLWKNKVAIVTGASAGIGAAICKDLCRNGIVVVGFARREERLKTLQDEIKRDQKSAKFSYKTCDVTVEEEIESAFAFVLETFGGVDILINNAGIFHNSALLDDGNLSGIRKVIDTNFVALVSCTKKAFSSMAQRNDPGYIINISSTAGHFVPTLLDKPMLNVYPATKFAVNALVQVLRHELNYFQKPLIRISNISPGCVKTDIAVAAGMPLDKGLAKIALLEPEDVSEAVLYVLGSNPRVQIQDLIIRPTGEFF